jgi:hypothetical protein
VRATLGEVEGAREDAERVMGMARQSEVGYAAGYVRSAIAFLELSIGDARAASESLEPHVAIIERLGQCNPTSASFGLPDEIEALVALGELGRADELTVILERHGRIHGRGSVLARASRCRALLSATRGDLAAAHEEIEQALTHDARVPIPVELGRTLLLKGQIERRGRKKRAARESFEQALGVFESTGARLWSTRVRTELERTGVRHSHGDALTPTELRVAELASAGLTNNNEAKVAAATQGACASNPTGSACGRNLARGRPRPVRHQKRRSPQRHDPHPGARCVGRRLPGAAASRLIECHSVARAHPDHERACRLRPQEHGQDPFRLDHRSVCAAAHD